MHKEIEVYLLLFIQRLVLIGERSEGQGRANGSYSTVLGFHHIIEGEELGDAGTGTLWHRVEWQKSSSVCGESDD